MTPPAKTWCLDHEVYINIKSACSELCCEDHDQGQHVQVIQLWCCWGHSGNASNLCVARALTYGRTSTNKGRLMCHVTQAFVESCTWTHLGKREKKAQHPYDSQHAFSFCVCQESSDFAFLIYETSHSKQTVQPHTHITSKMIKWSLCMLRFHLTKIFVSPFISACVFRLCCTRGGKKKSPQGYMGLKFKRQSFL